VEMSAGKPEGAELGRKLQALVDHVGTVVQGKREIVELAVTSLVAGGHLLLEDLPGLGKTTLAHALARSIGAQFRRVQFTNDLLPADILGVSIYERERGQFVLRPGPIFANVVLADEINRATPRTQSALLEAMAEGQVSMDDGTHPLPRPFWVLATQNPLEVHGTYPLPESQLDRFLMRLSLGYPERTVERALLRSRRREEPVDTLPAILDLAEVEELQDQVDDVHVDESLLDYLLAVIEASRAAPELASGASTRAALALLRAARAHALLRGRTYCLPDDLLAVFGPCLAHRLRLREPPGPGQQRRAELLVAELVARLPVPA